TSQLLQPTFIVPYLVLLNTLILEILKQADLLKNPWGGLILYLVIVCLVSLYAVLRLWPIMTNVGQIKDRTLQRFLQWAERDIEEAQVLRAQRLRRELLGADGHYR